MTSSPIPTNLRAQTLLFDLDNTLLDRAAAVDAYLNELLTRYPPSGSARDRRQTLEELRRLDDMGYGDRGRFFDAVTVRLQLPMSAEELAEDFLQRLPRCIRPDPGILSLIERWSDCYGVGVVSNGSSRNQRSKLAALGLAERIDHVFISEEMGANKPDALIFQMAVQRMAATPENALFIGDHPESDIAGAQRAGLWTCWLSLGREFPNHLPSPDFQIESLCELQRVLPCHSR